MKKWVNPLKADPTRLTTTRREMLRVVAEGWEVLGMRIQKYAKANEIGLVSNADPEYSNDKLKRFRSWLRDQMGSTLAGDALLGKYIEQGFDRGLGRSHTDSKRTGHTKHVASTADFTAATKGKPVTVEKLKLLASRTFAEMEDVNVRTATRMSRVLADGLVQGKTVDQVAKELDNETDIGANRARTVARTELTRAHAEGQLISMSHIGVSRTSAKVELSANGNACDQCASLDGKVYSLAKASGVIPVHPNCNCVWTPIPEGT